MKPLLLAHNKKLTARFALFVYVFFIFASFTFSLLAPKQADAFPAFLTPQCKADKCEYVFLAPIGALGVGQDGRYDVSGAGANNYLVALYTFGIVLASALAVMMIVIGGAQYASSDAIQGKSDAKTRIQAAVTGLILALLSFTILKTINVNLINVNFSPSAIDVNTTTATPAVVPVTATDPGTGGQTGGPGLVDGVGEDGIPGTADDVRQSGAGIPDPNTNGISYVNAAGQRVIGGGPVAIDFDGSPGAYRVVEDLNGSYTINGKRYRSVGYENLANARSNSGAWVGVKTDNGQPIIGSGGTLSGQLSWGGGSVNGDTTAFVALSEGQLDAAKAAQPGFKLGDYVILTSNGKSISAVYADNAGDRPAKFSEVSPAAARALGIPHTHNSAIGNVSISLP